LVYITCDRIDPIKGGDKMSLARLLWVSLAVVLVLLFEGCMSTGRVVTPLHESVRDGEADKTLALLQEKGTDVNARDENGMTPLHYTATNGETDLAELLISRRADVNIRDDEGNTPLHWAVQNSFTAIAEMLLENGADPNIMNDEGKTALDIAEEIDSTDMINLLSRFIS
jgi:ankyrin repeat protein